MQPNFFRTKNKNHIVVKESLNNIYSDFQVYYILLKAFYLIAYLLEHYKPYEHPGTRFGWQNLLRNVKYVRHEPRTANLAIEYTVWPDHL